MGPNEIVRNASDLKHRSIQTAEVLPKYINIRGAKPLLMDKGKLSSPPNTGDISQPSSYSSFPRCRTVYRDNELANELASEHEIKG